MEEKSEMVKELDKDYEDYCDQLEKIFLEKYGREECVKKGEVVNVSYGYPKKGLKYDDAKLRWDLVPWKAMEDVVRVITYGANKYEANNWKKLDHPFERYFAAGMRHLVAYKQGEMIDKESGLPHLAHAACNMLFLMWFVEREG